MALYTPNSSKNPGITTAGLADDDSSDDNGDKNPCDTDDEEKHQGQHGTWNKRITYSIKHHLSEFQDLQNTCCRTVTTRQRKLELNSRTAGDGAGLHRTSYLVRPFNNGYTIFKTGRINTVDTRTHVTSENLGECGEAIPISCRPEKSDEGLHMAPQGAKIQEVRPVASVDAADLVELRITVLNGFLSF